MDFLFVSYFHVITVFTKKLNFLENLTQIGFICLILRAAIKKKNLHFCVKVPFKETPKF